MVDLVVARNLALGYGQQQVLAGLNFSLAAGKTLGIIGATGSGKTTLARALLGLMPPPGQVLAGSLQVCGAETEKLTERDWRQLRGRRVTMVFQDTGRMLDPQRRIRSQLSAYLKRHRPGITKTEFLALAGAALTQVGLPDVAEILNKFPHQLSGGQLQRLGVVFATILSPELIIADEPTSALDALSTKQLVQQLRPGPHALVLITHHVPLALRLADELLVLHEGQVVAQGTPAELQALPHTTYAGQLLAASRALSLGGTHG